MIRHLFHTLAILAVCIACRSHPAEASSCEHQFCSTEHAYMVADAVFLATSIGGDAIEPVFRVKRWFKSPPLPSLKTSTLKASSSIDRFIKGKDYIIYAAQALATRTTYRLSVLSCVGGTSMSPDSMLTTLKDLQATPDLLEKQVPYKLVFRGSVLQATHFTTDREGRGPLASDITFEIRELFKSDRMEGPTTPSTQRISIRVMQCGLGYQPGHEYIVFANPRWINSNTDKPTRVFGYESQCMPPQPIIQMDELDVLERLHTELSGKEDGHEQL